jgi:ankyrin repeat protein
VVCFLLQKNPQTNLHQALEAADRTEQMAVLQLLLDHLLQRSDPQLLLAQAVCQGHMNVVHQLLARKVVLPQHHQAAQEAAPAMLRQAVRAGRAELAQLLQSQFRRDVDFQALLCTAIYMGQLRIVQLLLHAVGTHVRLGGLLNRAAEAGHKSVAQLLLDYGADANAGQPLEQAVMMGRLGMVHLLLAPGADLNARQSRAKAAAERHHNRIQSKKGHLDVAYILRATTAAGSVPSTAGAALTMGAAASMKTASARVVVRHSNRGPAALRTAPGLQALVWRSRRLARRVADHTRGVLLGGRQGSSIMKLI